MNEAVNSSIPDPRQARRFVFTDCDYDPESGEAHLGYRFDDGPELIERIVFPKAPWPSEGSRRTAFRQALGILHLVAGVSYYKAGFSPEIHLESPEYSAGIRDFLTELYVEGLAEFAYVNQLDISRRLRFPVHENSAAGLPDTAVMLNLPERALVAMGGGKDSLVGLDMLQGAGMEVMPVCVGHSALISDVVRSSGLPLLQIRRELAPELAQMNAAGAWNGHVPVTAINSAILLCAAILYGFRHVVFSNERSADEATLATADGTAINHQFSKSTRFESAFRTVIASKVSPGIEYYSVLRPFSELGIVSRFCSLKKYHGIYSSCNRNFHLGGSKVEGRWCLGCPKCRFAALSLALFLTPAEVRAIQGGDLLDDLEQADGFRALCGLGRDKPFECVGEAGESRAALEALNRRADWSGHAVVHLLAPELSAVEVPSLKSLLQPLPRHFVPAQLYARLRQPGVSDAGT